MGNYEQLKQAVTAVIKTNGRQEITGQIMQSTLLSIINAIAKNALFAGVATPGTTPGTPDENVFYLAGPGVYPNFNSAKVTGISVFRNVGNVWEVTELLKIAGTTGRNENVVMSQKAITELLDDIDANVYEKEDKEQTFAFLPRPVDRIEAVNENIDTITMEGQPDAIVFDTKSNRFVYQFGPRYVNNYIGGDYYNETVNGPARKDKIYLYNNRLYTFVPGRGLVATTIIYDATGANTDGTMTQKAITELVNTNTNIDITSFAQLDDYKNLTDCGVYNVRLKKGNTFVSVGSLFIGSDLLRHVVNQTLVSNMIITGKGTIDGSHIDKTVNLMYRVYNINAPESFVPAGTWSKWQYIAEVLPTTGTSETATMSQKAITDALQELTNTLETQNEEKENKTETIAHLTQRFDRLEEVTKPIVEQSFEGQPDAIIYDTKSKRFVYQFGDIYVNNFINGDYYNETVNGPVRKDKIYICKDSLYIYDKFFNTLKLYSIEYNDIDSRIVRFGNEIAKIPVGNSKMEIESDGTIADGKHVYKNVITTSYKIKKNTFIYIDIDKGDENDIVRISNYSELPKNGIKPIEGAEFQEIQVYAQSKVKLKYFCQEDGFVCISTYGGQTPKYYKKFAISTQTALSFVELPNYTEITLCDIKPVKIVNEKFVQKDGTFGLATGQKSQIIYIFDIEKYQGQYLHVKSAIAYDNVNKYAYSIANDIDFGISNIMGVSYFHSINKELFTENEDVILVSGGMKYIAVQSNVNGGWLKEVWQTKFLAEKNCESLQKVNKDIAETNVRVGNNERKITEISDAINAGYDTDIIYWGNSMTVGNQDGTGVNIENTIQSIIGGTYLNCGIGGEETGAIAFRQGGGTLIIPAGNINGSYDYALLHDAFDAHLNSLCGQFDYGETCNPISLSNGETCSLRNDKSNRQFVISDYTGRPSNIPLMCRSKGSSYKAKIAVFWVGPNGTELSPETQDRPYNNALDAMIMYLDSMIAHMGHDRFIVVGYTTGTEGKRWDSMSLKFKKYGNRYVNSRELLCEYGMDIVGLVPTEQEKQQMAKWELPARMVLDGVHLTQYGYKALGTIIANRMIALGYNNLISK